MNYDNFYDGIEDIYATFGKKMPETKVLERIYDRVKQLPDGFIDFAAKRVEDLEKLPQNIGMYLLRELWPDYLEKHSELKSRLDLACCPRCCPDLPGWRKIYQPEVTGWGEETYKPVIIRCTCGNAPNPNHEKVYQDYELENMGFRLKCPFRWSRDNLPDYMRSSLGEKEIRPEHEEYKEKLEYGEW